jgi:hypothetical protein
VSFVLPGSLVRISMRSPFAPPDAVQTGFTGYGKWCLRISDPRRQISRA